MESLLSLYLFLPLYVISDGAGVDTTCAAINQFVAAMILHPEIQIRAQAEIDALTGKTRLPTFDELVPFIASRRI